MLGVGTHIVDKRVLVIVGELRASRNVRPAPLEEQDFAAGIALQNPALAVDQPIMEFE